MFVPRVVKKKLAPKPAGSSLSASSAKPAEGTGAQSSSSSAGSSTTLPPPGPARPVADGPPAPKLIPRLSADELRALEVKAVTLLQLVFSDHALWTPDELHLVARANQNQGYVPLNFLLANHPVLEPISHLPHPSITRALRQHGTPGLLRTRLAITEPRAWGGSKSYGEPGVEIGRADWGAEGARLGKAGEPWAERTLYVENFPAHLRTHAQLVGFLTSLLVASSSPSSNSIQPLVQSVSFDGPTFRSFVWVVLRDEAAVERVGQDWSWTGAVGRGKRPAKEGESDHERPASAAREAGLRVLPKRDYSRLEAEYLAHLATFPSTAPRPQGQKPTHPAARPLPPISSPVSTGSHKGSIVSEQRPEPAPSISSARPRAPSDYPQECLLFAKNLDPDSSNKTSLKAMFNAGLRSDEDVSKGAEVTYVDWSKGLDTCYVRVPHPRLSPLLLAYFARSESTVVLELVQGDREAIYWRANVKENIRLEAVRVAEGADEGGVDEVGKGGKKRRKM